MLLKTLGLPLLCKQETVVKVIIVTEKNANRWITEDPGDQSASLLHHAVEMLRLQGIASLPEVTQLASKNLPHSPVSTPT